jgi:transcriptional regulator with PAS, ATPase and Fis domain
MSEPMRSSDQRCVAPVIVGVSPAIRRAVALARRFAPTPLPILLVGATGTGKELFARAIHAWSGRNGEFVDVNCGALPRELIESLLFGHGPRAFTGAVEAVMGLIEAAHDGTLFLDELSSLALEGQVKLLRALETGEIRRVGELGKRQSDFRLIASAQENLCERLSAREFRLDLFHRVAGVVIDLPPLAQRSEDIGPLAEFFAAKQGTALTPAVVAALRCHEWSGNARELRAVVQRTAILAGGKTVAPRDVREAMALSLAVVTATGNETSARERWQLLDACAVGEGGADRVAELLGVSRATLFRRLKAAGLSLRLVGSTLRPKSSTGN